MSKDKPSQSDPPDPDALAHALDLQTADLMEMVAQLSRRDLAAVAAIVRRAAEISETEGEDVALAVLDQLHGILAERNLDA